MAKKQTKGACVLCGKSTTRAAMERHLPGCRAEHPVPPKKGWRAADGFLIRVASKHLSPYWMFLEMPKEAGLELLDHSLRRRWLECCGHMSQFEIDGRYFCGREDDLFEMEGVSDDLTTPASRVLKVGTEFAYEYDFGSTTELTLKVVAEYRTVFKIEEAVRVLARNDPPEILCTCGKPATLLDTQGENALCVDCFRDSNIGEDELLALMNSPRAGVCAYGADEVGEILGTDADEE